MSRVDRQQPGFAGTKQRCLPGALLAVLLLTTTVPADLHASPSMQPADSHGKASDYDARLESLRAAQQMYPLDQKRRHDLAEAYANYGNLLASRRQYEQADEYFIKAAELYPDEAVFALSRGVCNYYLKRYDIARSELERARLTQPASVDVLYYLGLVLYETDRRPEAVELWELALKQAPDRPGLLAVLQKARREMSVEDSMDRGHSSRFNLTYDPGVSTTLALAILDVLESAANQVGAELGHFPVARVPVAIYKRDDFKDVTNSPDWSGGVYDGTIRLPFGSLSEISPSMRAILFHEYAHVVVFDLTRGNCPVWFNEGIAESFGRRQLETRPDHTPATPLSRETAIDFSRLEKGFGGLSNKEAMLAYEQSYSIVNYFAATYGWHRVTALLTLLGKGKSFPAAMAEILGDYSLNYGGLVEDWRATLP